MKLNGKVSNCKYREKFLHEAEEMEWINKNKTKIP